MGQARTLHAIGANTYSWSTGAGTSSINVNPTSTTTYTVIGTSSVGCVSSSTITQKVSSCTGLAKNVGDQTFQLYPNPSNGEFVLEFTKEADLIIYNSIGQQVTTQRIYKGKNQMNVTLSPGVYLFSISEGNSKFAGGKLIIQ